MSYWKDKPVLITGSNGFIGSHLTKALLQKKASVIALSSVQKMSPLLSREDIKRLKVENQSIENFNKLKEIIKKNKVKIIFHLAAQPLVEIGTQSPLKTFEVNIKGTWNILEAARNNNLEKVIIASTTHVYGDNPHLPYKEEYYPQPSRPYETSKACADLLAQSYADTYGLPVEIPRFVNIYGPGDFNFTRLIPKTIRSVLFDRNPWVWDVGAVRDFLFIDDAIDAYIKLAEENLPNNKRLRVINFGSGKQTSIDSIVKRIVLLSGNQKLKYRIRLMPEERKREILKQYISIEKAKAVLNWTPKFSLERGLETTICWYKEYFKKNMKI